MYSLKISNNENLGPVYIQDFKIYISSKYMKKIYSLINEENILFAFTLPQLENRIVLITILSNESLIKYDFPVNSYENEKIKLEIIKIPLLKNNEKNIKFMKLFIDIIDIHDKKLFYTDKLENTLIKFLNLLPI